MGVKNQTGGEKEPARKCRLGVQIVWSGQKSLFLSCLDVDADRFSNEGVWARLDVFERGDEIRVSVVPLGQAGVGSRR